MDRAVVLMDLLGRSDTQLNLTDISTRLKLHKSTTQRFSWLLQAHHLVSCRVDGRYHLGLRLHDLGDALWINSMFETEPCRTSAHWWGM
jgi:DNA-binding IclR family transcriptional regulator